MRTSVRSALAGLVSLSIVAAAGASPVGAGPDRTAVCHWDAESDAHVLLVIGSKAAAKHLANHEHDAVPGDDLGPDCEAQLLAFASVTSTSASGEQMEVARIVDADDDGALGLGDVVVTRSYPNDHGGAAYGQFAVNSHPITGINVLAHEFVNVTSEGNSFYFLADSYRQVFFEESADGSYSWLQDSMGDPYSPDSVSLNNGGPSPSSPADSGDRFGVVDEADNSFLDVVIALP